MRFSKSVAFLLCLICFTGISNIYAAHIVGGDFSYKHISGDTYEIKMKMYRDCGGGGAGFENQLSVGLYDKETDELVQFIFMPRTIIYPIKFNTGCTNPQLRCVETGIFTAKFTMPKSLFNNTQGYYVQWERCCRNDIIKNIVNPGGTPMAFYMELPSPYPGDGSFRLNSSPEFKRDPLNYLCVGEPFKYDFKVYDSDGDELRMKIGIPNAGGYTSISDPGQNTGPGPYAEILWRPGYRIGVNQNIMDGNPDLYVDDDTAFIYLVPQQIGVYVISVICEEYRNGFKIGEIVRELQLEVLICPPRFKPDIKTNIAGVNNVVNAVVGQQICFDLSATDLNKLELLKFRIDTGGLYKNLLNTSPLSPPDVTGTQNITARFCWTPTCPLDTTNGTFLDFIVYDNSCPFSQDDTVRVKFRIIQTPNILPTIKTNLSDNVFNVRVNESLCFQFQASDGNPNDQLLVEPVVNEVDVYSLGAFLNPNVLTGNTSVSSQFCWSPPCNVSIDTSFTISFIVGDNACIGAGFDTVEVKINVLPLLNEAPEISAQGVNIGVNNTINVNLDEQNCFSIFAEDFDEDVIDVYTKDVNYDFFNNGAIFTSVQDIPNSQLKSFCWTPSCDNFNGVDTLYLDFFTRDNKCINEKFDSVRVRFVINLPDNDEPSILKPDSSLYNINAGYSRAVEVSAYDFDDDDLLILSARPLYASNVPMRIEMSTAQGNSNVESILNVYPDCGIQGNVDYPVEITLLSNKFCSEYDTVKRVVYFRAAPLLDIGKPLIPDVFSPNGDGVNDEYKIYLANRTICPDEFEFIIFDRWGQKMLETKDPEFVWRAEGCTPGAYVYYLRIGEEKSTGFIALVK